jgi:hypothetical protein
VNEKYACPGVELRRLIWVGPITVLASIVAVLVLRGIAMIAIHPDPSFLPLTLMPPILDTAVLVTLAVFVFRRVLSGQGLPGPLLALIGAQLFMLDGVIAFRRLAFRALLISFLPDIGIAISSPRHWMYAIVLATMHIAAWGVCVPMLANLTAVQRPGKAR